ncbi:alpha-N-acetylgalactosaminide alpha-2,6-sialyltransferase 1-like [Erpetoichthys calabaricus]|uniref:alpha-N-acetylgalactosaminide alpha-2,6-sialyltransferase n=1 Tax=Erpetoichthys calabaricus TaxID=27687 RepID=A0A8C4XCR9_ERPCA|nr:alpha-N-acetylgalactosaminide alpha-2,6-sialyltransferase 1-like [Erpetoichthys calabaricus]
MKLKSKFFLVSVAVTVACCMGYFYWTGTIRICQQNLRCNEIQKKMSFGAKDVNVHSPDSKLEVSRTQRSPQMATTKNVKRTKKKPLMPENFKYYPTWEGEEDYHRDPDTWKTTCPVSLRNSQVDWFKRAFIPDIALLLHKEHFNDEEWKRLEHFQPPFGWMAANYSVVKQAVNLLPGIDKQRLLLAKKDGQGCIRCAVVGNGGILNGSRKGAEIDSHDYVFRVNGAVIKGFEQDVGTRTSFYVHTSYSITTSLYLYKHLGFKAIPQDKETQYILLPEGIRDYEWMTGLLLNTAVTSGYYKGENPRKYFTPNFTAERYFVLHPDFNRYVRNRYLKSQTMDGTDWAIYRPTTGSYSLILALHVCDIVNAYGYITEDYNKYSDHYYDINKTETIFYLNHDYDVEIKIWKKFHEAKLFNLYQKTSADQTIRKH